MRPNQKRRGIVFEIVVATHQNAAWGFGAKRTAGELRRLDLYGNPREYLLAHRVDIGLVVFNP